MIRKLAAVALVLCTAASLTQAATTSKSKRKPAPAPVVAPMVLPPADAEQLVAADMAHVGDYACEFNQAIKVSAHPGAPGYLDVDFGKLSYTMRPVLSSTGALRLEDVRGQTMMLQIAYKSMLMDVKAGRRLVDECASEAQLTAKRNAEGQPAVSLMGDAPVTR
jgi:hypothetical protein